MTDFQQKVYEVTRRIPCGKLATYGQIARVMGCPGAGRAVGNALHVNERPDVIPCRRVVNAQGRVAENFGLGGAAVQRRLLEEEGIVFDDKGCADLSVYGCSDEDLIP